MKNFLFYTSRSLRSGGGYQEWQRRASFVLSRSHDVRVLYSDVCDPARWTTAEVKKKFAHCTFLEEIEYWDFDLPLHKKGRFARWYLPKIKDWVRVWKTIRWADVVYFNHFFPVHDPFPKMLAYVLRKKIVFGFHSPAQPGMPGACGVLCQWVVRQADITHTINTTFHRWLSNFSPKNSKYIANFLLTEEVPKRLSARSDGDFLFVGRYEDVKQIQLVTESVRQAMKKDEGVTINFHGSGLLDYVITELEKESPKNVKNYGYTQDKKKIYNGKKFLVITSRDEPFGLVVIEAMSYGVPVISTDTYGPRDIIDDGVDGIIVKSNSPEVIAEAILSANKMPQEVYEEMSKKAREKVLVRYTEAQFERDFKKMLESI